MKILTYDCSDHWLNKLKYLIWKCNESQSPWFLTDVNDIAGMEAMTTIVVETEQPMQNVPSMTKLITDNNCCKIVEIQVFIWLLFVY